MTRLQEKDVSLSPAWLTTKAKMHPKLHDLGVHGTEAVYLVRLISILLVISLLTSAASMFLLLKLRLFPGSEAILFREDGSVLFKDDIAIDTLQLKSKHMRDVQTMDGNILMQAGESHISIAEEGIDVIAPHGLRVVSAKTGRQIFPVDFGSQPLPSSLSSLSLKSGAKNVKKIRSPADQDLEMSGGSVRVGGSQGLRVEGRQVSIDGHEIHISSRNGSIVLDAAAGVFMPNIRVADVDDNSNQTTMQYKLCVCGKTGRIFRVHMKTSDTTCADVRFPESVNPCI